MFLRPRTLIHKRLFIYLTSSRNIRENELYLTLFLTLNYSDDSTRFYITFDYIIFNFDRMLIIVRFRK